eukprot:5858529-Alexandrium_andersonii.AAC.1
MARQCRSPPRSAIRHAYNDKSLEAFEPGTSRAQERPQIGLRSSRGDAFCAGVRGCRIRPRNGWSG